MTAPSLPSGETTPDEAPVQPGEPDPVHPGLQAGGPEARPAAGGPDPLAHAAVAGEGRHLRQEHDAAPAPRRHLLGDRDHAGGAAGGQQGLCLAQAGPESDGGSTQVEETPVQELELWGSRWVE